MTEVAEDRVYARHPRRRGAVLIVGAGAVGGLTAQQLAPMGISPLWLVDPKVLAMHNIVRHPLGAEEVGQPKALALAERIHRGFPLCNAIGIQADFTKLSDAEQLRLVREADVVIAATDSVDCQRRVNQVCLQAEVTAVYPAVWVDERIRDAEVGEILWVLPGRYTPCYECAAAFRQGAGDAQAARGARVDIELLALTTAQVVAALLEPTDERSRILDPERTAIYVHGLTPTSPGIQATFPAGGLQSRSVRVPFPRQRCPACGGQEGPTRPALTPPRQAPALPTPAPAEPRSGWFYLRRRRLQYIAGLSVTVVVLLALIGWLLDLVVSRPTSRVVLSAPTSQQAQASEPTSSAVPQQTAAPSSVEATSVAAPSVQAAIEPPGDTQSPTDAPFPKNLSLSCSYSITSPYGDFVPCPKLAIKP